MNIPDIPDLITRKVNTLPCNPMLLLLPHFTTRTCFFNKSRYPGKLSACPRSARVHLWAPRTFSSVLEYSPSPLSRIARKTSEKNRKNCVCARSPRQSKPYTSVSQRAQELCYSFSSSFYRRTRCLDPQLLVLFPHLPSPKSIVQQLQPPPQTQHKSPDFVSTRESCLRDQNSLLLFPGKTTIQEEEVIAAKNCTRSKRTWPRRHTSTASLPRWLLARSRRLLTGLIGSLLAGMFILRASPIQECEVLKA